MAFTIPKNPIESFVKEVEEFTGKAFQPPKLAEPKKPAIDPEFIKATSEMLTTGAKKVAKDIGQSFAREYISIGQIAARNLGIVPKDFTFTPTTPFEKTLTGTSQPISLTSIGKEMRTAFGGKEETKPILDPSIGLVIGLLDVIPGLPKVKVFEKIALSKNADDIAKILRKSFK